MMQIPTFPVLKSSQSDRYLVPMSVFVRAVAWVIDIVLLTLVTIVVMYAANLDTKSFLQSVSNGTVSVRTLDIFLFASAGAQILYFFIWEATVGWTPGKRVFQMKVVQLDGRRCGVLHSFVRNILRPVDLLFFGIVGALAIATGFKRQRLGDRAARTQVVREVPMALIPPPYAPADASTRRCPRCGVLVEASATHCPICSVDMDEAEQAWRQALPPFLTEAFGPAAQCGATGTQRRSAEPEEYDDEFDDEDVYDEGDGHGYDGQAAYDGEAGSHGEAGYDEDEDGLGEKPAPGVEEDSGRAQPAGMTASASHAGPAQDDEKPAPADDTQNGSRRSGQRAPAGRPAEQRRQTAASRGGAGSAMDRRRPAARRPDRTHRLVDDDEYERSSAAREILLDGSKDEVRTLAKILPKWDEEDREFVVAVARTLDGWRPTLVLEALRNDADEEVREAAIEALERVAERSASKRRPTT